MAHNLPSVVERPSRVRYGVLAWLCAAAVIAYVERSALGVAAQPLQAELGLSQAQLGALMSVFFWAYALAQVPMGLIGQSAGARRSLTVFSLIGGGAMLLIAGSQFAVICGALLLLGVSQAGLFPCCVTTFRDWFPPSQRSMPSGMLTSAMAVGGVLAGLLAGLLIEPLGWRALYTLFAAPALVWSVGFIAWFRNTPREHPSVNAAELKWIEAPEQSAETVSAQPTDRLADADRGPATFAPRLDARALLLNGRMHLVCLQHALRAAGVVFYQTWFPTYLTRARGLSVADAGYGAAAAMGGLMLGALVGGLASDVIYRATGSRRASRQGVALVSTFGCAICLTAAYLIPNVQVAMGAIVLGAALAAMSSPIAYTITIDLGGRHVATVFSAMNMAGNLGGAACPLLVERFVERGGGDWSTALLLFVGIYLAAGACWLGLDPRGSLFPEARSTGA